MNLTHKNTQIFPSDQFWRSDEKSLQIKLKKYSDYQKFFIQVLRLCTQTTQIFFGGGVHLQGK